MASIKKNISFSNAIITIEDGEFIITETKKDDTRVYNLSRIIKEEWENVENIKLTIDKSTDIPSEE